MCRRLGDIGSEVDGEGGSESALVLVFSSGLRDVREHDDPLERR